MILFPGSRDSQHRGHRNIEKKAERYFGEPIHSLIVASPAKDSGLLSLSERYRDMVISYFSYGVRDGQITRNNRSEQLAQIKGRIYIASTKEQMTSLMEQATHLIRGIRNEEDKEYSLQLLQSLGKPERLKKSTPIYQDEEYQKTSSTEYKKAFALLSEEQNIQLPDIYSFLNTETIVLNCQKVLGDSMITPNIQKLEGEITEYFDLVTDLEKDGWYKDLVL